MGTICLHIRIRDGYINHINNIMRIKENTNQLIIIIIIYLSLLLLYIFFATILPKIVFFLHFEHLIIGRDFPSLEISRKNLHYYREDMLL